MSSSKAVGVICGLGVYGYTAAIQYCLEHLKDAAPQKA